MKDFIGVSFLFCGYVAGALLLAFLSGMSLDRALMFVMLYAASQVRWFGRDESPLAPGVRAKQSFMSRVRGE